MVMKKGVVIFAFVLLSIAIVSAAPADHLSLWKFEGNLLDSSGNYDGTGHGNISYISGVLGQALQFNEGYVSFGDVVELNSAEAFTFSTWVRDDAPGAQKLLLGKINGLDHDISVGTFLGRLYFEVGDGENSYAYWANYSEEIDVGEWEHLTFVYDGNEATNSGRAKVYLNGMQKPLFFSGTFPSQTSNLSLFSLLFSTSGANRWRGAIDETYLYTRALNGSEIMDIYEGEILCGNGLLDRGEECDDGNVNDYDSCTNVCTFGLLELPVETCQGEGEFYAYHTTPTQDLAKSFVTAREELYIFTRSDYISDVAVELNGVSVSKSIVVDVVVPFPVRVYKVETSPGDVVSVHDGSIKDARAIQGYLTQDPSSEAFDIGAFNIVFDGDTVNTLNLLPGTYDYLIFDKYSVEPPSMVPDTRRLSLTLTDDTNAVIFDRDYFQPHPSPVEGIVLDSYTVGSAGEYELEVDTEDSVYWFLQECAASCPDADGDGVCDTDDECPDSDPNEPVDEDGCDIFQFCEQRVCGYDCYTADWMDNENEQFPNDCTVVIRHSNGLPQQPVCVPTVATPMCAG